MLVSGPESPHGAFKSITRKKIFQGHIVFCVQMSIFWCATCMVRIWLSLGQITGFMLKDVVPSTFSSEGGQAPRWAVLNSWCPSLVSLVRTEICCRITWIDMQYGHEWSSCDEDRDFGYPLAFPLVPPWGRQSWLCVNWPNRCWMGCCIATSDLPMTPNFSSFRATSRSKVVSS